MRGPILSLSLFLCFLDCYGLPSLHGRILPAARDELRSLSSLGVLSETGCFWECCCTFPKLMRVSFVKVVSECSHCHRADFLAGVPFFVTIIQIPQRFQIVNGTSTLEAGVRMLPFILGVPISTAFASISASKLKMPPIYLFALGCVFQSVGTGLMSTLPVDMGPKDYGYEVILGLGLGLNIGSVIIVTPNLIQGKDQCPYIHPTLVFSHFSRSSGTSRS